MSFNPLSILGWITGLPLSKISDDIARVQIAKQNAATDKDRLDHEEREKALLAQQAVMVAEAGNRINTFMRVFLGLPAGLIIWQYIVFDKIVAPWFGGHATDDLSDQLWYYVMVVIGFYFLHWTVGSWRK